MNFWFIITIAVFILLLDLFDKFVRGSYRQAIAPEPDFEEEEEYDNLQKEIKRLKKEIAKLKKEIEKAKKEIDEKEE